MRTWEVGRSYILFRGEGMGRSYLETYFCPQRTHERSIWHSWKGKWLCGGMLRNNLCMKLNLNNHGQIIKQDVDILIPKKDR